VCGGPPPVNKLLTYAAVQAELIRSKVPSLHGVVSFDATGDLTDGFRVFHYQRDARKLLDDLSAWLHILRNRAAILIVAKSPNDDQPTDPFR
jgi:hypothetical protein